MLDTAFNTVKLLRIHLLKVDILTFLLFQLLGVVVWCSVLTINHPKASCHVLKGMAPSRHCWDQAISFIGCPQLLEDSTQKVCLDNSLGP